MTLRAQIKKNRKKRRKKENRERERENGRKERDSGILIKTRERERERNSIIIFSTELIIVDSEPQSVTINATTSLVD